MDEIKTTMLHLDEAATAATSTTVSFKCQNICRCKCMLKLWRKKNHDGLFEMWDNEYNRSCAVYCRNKKKIKLKNITIAELECICVFFLVMSHT